MSKKTPPQPRKLPQQSRSRETVRAIREACARIVYQQGPAAVTTARIAEIAGVNIASLYQYFPNKQAVLADFYEAETAAFAAVTAKRIRLIDRLSRESLEKTLAAIIDLELEQLLALARLHPEFFAQYRASFNVHDKVNEMTQALRNPSWEEWFPQFLDKHRQRLRTTDNLALLGEVAYRALHGALQTIAIRRIAGNGGNGGNGASEIADSNDDQEALGSQALKCELLYLLLSYLLAEPPAHEDCRQFFNDPRV